MQKPVEKAKIAALALLRHEAAGRLNAMPLDEIGARLDLPWRSVAAIIQALRRDGWLIGTVRSGDHRGAYWPVTADDQRDALRAYARAFASMARVYARLRRHVPRNVVIEIEAEVKLKQMELFVEP